MRHAGILAHSVEGAALCLRAFAQYAGGDLGAHMHPDVTLDCIAMGHSMPFWDAGDRGPIRAILATSVDRLALAGADFFACPDNTAHLALQASGPQLALPGLHIAAVVADHAAAKGHRKVGILGTRFTMESELYPHALGQRGIHAVVPEAADRAAVDQIIFGELVAGIFTDASRARYVRVIEKLAGAGCDAVALVCTEIPLLVDASCSPLPVLDSTRLLARAAAEVATGRREMPVWRGGPMS